jgi:hypothetical protein
MFKGKVVGSGAENIIFGPWIRNGAGNCHEKILADGQRIRVFNPPYTDSAAVIPQSFIVFDTHQPDPNPNKHSLRGIISQISLEASGKTVMISARTGDQTFSLSMPAEKALKLDLFPGRIIYITYPMQSVAWY